MSEAITKALQDVIAAHDHSLAIMGEQMRYAGVTALTIGGPEGDAALKMFEAISAARAALSQPAPSPQPAVPVVSDEQIRKTVESIQDPGTVAAFHNGYYTLTPDELRRAILALRPAVEPMTPEQMRAILTEAGYDDANVQARADFINGARYGERHHGITAKAEDAHQPTKEAE